MRQFGKRCSAGTIFERDSAARRAALAALREPGSSRANVSRRRGRRSASCRNASCWEPAARRRLAPARDAPSMTACERSISSASCAGSVSRRVPIPVLPAWLAPQPRPT